MKMDIVDYLRYHKMLAHLDRRKRQATFGIVTSGRHNLDWVDSVRDGFDPLLGLNGSPRPAPKEAVA